MYHAKIPLIQVWNTGSYCEASIGFLQEVAGLSRELTERFWVNMHRSWIIAQSDPTLFYEHETQDTGLAS